MTPDTSQGKNKQQHRNKNCHNFSVGEKIRTKYILWQVDFVVALEIFYNCLRVQKEIYTS